jgi:YHS domain-containing protein
MKQLSIFAFALIVLGFSNCKNNSVNNATTNTATQSVASEETADSIRHAQMKKLTIANEDDPACGMPLLRGFDDTATYKGKLIGFCSKECKDNFMKNPSKYPIKYK